MSTQPSPIFIIGSPRSGTTLLGEILALHPDVAAWYEPYFVWDRYFRDSAHDRRSAADATATVKHQIRDDFHGYQQRVKRPIIIDKSPRNSLKIPFILEIFPDARFVHILRDGRDVTLSINKEWKKREQICGSDKLGGFNHVEALRVVREWLQRQPCLSDHIRALWFETHGHLFDKTRHLNRLRWNGNVGWGPRYTGWEKDYEAYSCLEFNALQWLNCVTAIRQDWNMIGEDKIIEIRYEDLVSNNKNTLAMVFNHLDRDVPSNFYSQTPHIKVNNYNKWRNELEASDISLLKPLLSPLLEELNYVQQFPW